jgi:hypothetical protein
MKKLRVFVDGKGDVVATGPAPREIVTKAEGPVFIGFGPANEDNDYTAYEMDVEDDFQPSRKSDSVEAFHGRVAELIRTKKDLKKINFRDELKAVGPRR